MDSSRCNFSVSSFISNTYLNYLNVGVDVIEQVGTEDMKIPNFSEEILLDLCEAATEHFKNLNQTLLRIDPPVIVVGDIHGNLHDLLRIWNSIDDIFEQKVLFLGDYVDRGQYQLETITLLFALTLEYSNNIFLLRGNHEFPAINVNSFKQEICSAGYSEDLFYKFNEAFSWMPIAALIGNEIFCVHGGLSPHFREIQQLETEFQLPIIDFAPLPASKKKENASNTVHQSQSSSICQPSSSSPIIQNLKSSRTEALFDIEKNNMALLTDLMWSDPTNDCENYIASNRGSGVYFGYLATHKFLSRNNLKVIVRAHEAIQSGVRLMHDSKCITVFSTSGYRNANLSGIIKFTNNVEDRKSFRLNPITVIPRDEAQFYTPLVKSRDPNQICLVPILCDRVMYSHHSSQASLSQKINRFVSISHIASSDLKQLHGNESVTNHSVTKYNSFSGESSSKQRVPLSPSALNRPNIIRPLISSSYPFKQTKRKRSNSTIQHHQVSHNIFEDIPV